MDHLTQVIEKEMELQELAVEGENVIQYFNENPEKKQVMVDKYHKLRDDIANSDIPNAYKDPMLGSINKYLNKLNPNHQENKNQDLLLYGILGAVAGVMLVHGLDKLMKNMEEKIADGIIGGIYKGMGDMSA